MGGCEIFVCIRKEQKGKQISKMYVFMYVHEHIHTEKVCSQYTYEHIHTEKVYSQYTYASEFPNKSLTTI